MPKVSLSGMTVEALMDLRMRVDEMLHRRRAELEKQLEGMDRAIAVIGGGRVVRGGGSALKGMKVPPKYRSPRVRLGQVVGQSQGGLLLRSKVERNSTIS